MVIFGLHTIQAQDKNQQYKKFSIVHQMGRQQKKTNGQSNILQMTDHLDDDDDDVVWMS